MSIADCENVEEPLDDIVDPGLFSGWDAEGIEDRGSRPGSDLLTPGDRGGEDQLGEGHVPRRRRQPAVRREQSTDELSSRRLNVDGFLAWLGFVEVVFALLIALCTDMSTSVGSGSALAVGMFLTTLSFVVTTPGDWEQNPGHCPHLSKVPGEFLVKDLVLLGARAGP